MTQRKLLIVTADPKLARQANDVLGASFQLGFARPGEQAAMCLRGNVPLDVLLVDHLPPAPIGEAIRLLERAQELRPDVRRGLFTGYGDVGEIIRAVHNESAQFVLHRPIVPTELLAALAAVPRCADAGAAAHAADVA